MHNPTEPHLGRFYRSFLVLIPLLLSACVPPEVSEPSSKGDQGQDQGHEIFISTTNNQWYSESAAVVAETNRQVQHLALQAGSAKNIILFVGDGMGITTVTAARIFQGQQQGMSG